METRKDRMKYKYEPKVHDYVMWRKNNMTHQGWVYYKGEEHISIELGVNEKPLSSYAKNQIHKKNHILIVCPRWEWDNLEYVTQRDGYHDDKNVL